MTLSGMQYVFPAPFPWSEKLVSKLSEREYRHAYMIAGVKTWISRQVRTLREQRGWSQEDLGRELGKPQSAISRVEDPDYGKLTLQTLFDLARAYDLPLLVQFVEWSDWLSRMDNASTEALQKHSFNGDLLREVINRQVGINEVGQQPGFIIDPFAQQETHGVTFTGYAALNFETLLNSSHVFAPTLTGGVQVYSTEDTKADYGMDEDYNFTALAASRESHIFGAE